MASSSLSWWIAFLGALLLAMIAADTLVPVDWQIRLGLHYLVEHFLAYFLVSFVICLAWRRPLVVAASLMALAGLLEAGQGLTADRIPDLATALCGAAGVLAGSFSAQQAEVPAAKA